MIGTIPGKQAAESFPWIIDRLIGRETWDGIEVPIVPLYPFEFSFPFPRKKGEKEGEKGGSTSLARGYYQQYEICYFIRNGNGTRTQA